MASVSPAFVLLRRDGLAVESPSWPGTCYVYQAGFELTATCLPLSSEIRACDTNAKETPVLPVPSSHLQTHLLHRTCHDPPGLTPPSVPLFSIPLALGVLYTEVSCPQCTRHGVCLSQCHRNTGIIHTSAGLLMPEAQVPCLGPSVCPQILRLVPRCGSSAGWGGFW